LRVKIETVIGQALQTVVEWGEPAQTRVRSAPRTRSAGQATTFYYDELGRVKKVVDALGNFTLTTYDPNGNAHTRADQLGRITTYGYDALNRLISTTDPLVQPQSVVDN
jgi:YD repeat-containing protein